MIHIAVVMACTAYGRHVMVHLILEVRSTSVGDSVRCRRASDKEVPMMVLEPSRCLHEGQKIQRRGRGRWRNLGRGGWHN